MNEEIFWGLQTAVDKGETLQQAMMSFYNAGYKKEDIEEAAKALHIQMLQRKGGISVKSLPLNTFNGKEISTELKNKKETPKQIVSKYEQKPAGYGIKQSGRILIIFLFFILFILLAGLSTILLFKEESLNFLRNLFS